MNQNLYRQVSEWFEAHREDLMNDIIRLVRIESVSNPDALEKPFGAGCRKCLEEMLKIGEEHGFYTENYEYYVGSIGSKEKNWDNMIGFWNHMDVVPAGNNWDYEPFSPIQKEHFLIGRGSGDNKGPAIGILYMMQCLRELQIPLKHELCLFVGCDEERGMADLDYYTKHYQTPKLSMIADSGFPVCYGEKGIIEGRMRAKENIPAELLDCGGGNAANMIPAYLSEDYYGSCFQIEYRDEVSGNTTCAATVLQCEDRHLVLTFNIRYAITDEPEKILAGMQKGALQHDMVWELERDSAPNYFPEEHPAVSLLTNLYNEITGENKECFVMGGGTYARKLPHAFAYGIGGMQRSEEDKKAEQQIFRPGHGGAHEPDEGLNLRLFLEAMKIYTMAVIALNDCDL